MTNIFIGGSRKISRLPQSVLQRLDNIIHNQFTILVGDASGIDLHVQKYLISQNYQQVIIFCTGNTCRNNAGQWETRHVTATKNSKGFDFYAIKDLQMAKEASYGFMIWDGKSKGTLNNVLNLLRLDKKSLVYFAPTQSFQTVRTPDELRTLLALCDRQDIANFERELSLQQFFIVPPPTLPFNTPELALDAEKIVALQFFVRQLHTTNNWGQTLDADPPAEIDFQCDIEEIVADYEDLERDDLLAVLAFAQL